MAATKVNVNEIPADVLGDIQSLVSLSKKEYISIGKSIYQIEPAPAIVLMEAMGEFTSLLDTLRKKKIEMLKSQAPDIDTAMVDVYIKDIVYNSESGTSLSGVLDKLLQGVEKSDLDAMNIGQMLNAIDKAIKINLDTLPASFRESFIPREVQQVMQQEDEAPKVEDSVGDEEIKNP